MCSGSQGLLSKIVEALKRETTGSTFRFWFSRAIESYLRSANPYADQVFLLRRGLLKHLANSLLMCDSGHNQKEVLQSTFDLLGELLKFNVDAYRRLDNIISTEPREKKLFRLVTKNLVDSNMLVRSLVLSSDLFMREGKATEFAARSRTLRHVATFKQRLDFLVQLIKTISVDTLTQENVSCLNTSLVILMLAHRHSELPLYLEGLRSHVEPHLLTNLRSLLRFWQTHYLHNKDKDCNTLQRSSGISFDFWRETVATLVAENKLSPDCIYHYLSPEDLNLSRTS
ncbi:short transient receptor potential channel 4-associated protein-like [Penaeus monodon]|uniref:short transient receptor potential channel 4-associated protein-like n=1 Tax=Penaeus monodon TaxID=6687 RepID=UPI0018A735D1|nr:short transient receptor potential channel 4-associated protein-like [Penaeus monodon]